ncbi:MAG TPA: cupin-like domain-containing protein [Ideonella sp.]|uniref:cupin-like domain-containing protein n=1 Tax=Ideonella sp. TaxID=1929293 RepID=UPI002E34F943|nr:cupin-like domain-containing protein [Ideonella sp.]HEX5688225.1 cupin-like domain-containing protein [Ideonella sp.]
MRELTDVDPRALPDALLRSTEPVVVRGLVREWPAVQAVHAPGGVHAYLRRFACGATVGAWFGPPEIEGRFGYNADLSGFNFAREMVRFEAMLDTLERHQADDHPPALYVGSTTIDTCLPGFRAENDLSLSHLQPLASLWLGNRARVAAHQDLPDNLACVVVGRRRFTLLPPDEVGNLYIGPLEHTLAGQPTSLVDFNNPDLARFPKFAQALRRAQVAELGPGDAIFMPSMWWHHVEALDPFNLLVNYWWRQSPEHMDSPMAALLLAIMSVRDLPQAQRDAWRSLFDHYVFDAGADTAAHLPPAARQILAAPLDGNATRALRARVIRRLNR